MGFKSYQKTLSLTLESGLVYSRVVGHPFILLSAKLAKSTTNEDKVQVILENKNEDKFKLCTLWKKRNIDVASLSILFSKGDEIKFYLSGEGEVVLSGFFVVDSADSQALAKDISKNVAALKQDVLSRKKNKKNVINENVVKENGIKENKDKVIDGEKENKNFQLKKNKQKNNKNLKSPEKTGQKIQEIDLVDESIQEICQDDSIIEINQQNGKLSNKKLTKLTNSTENSDKLNKRKTESLQTKILKKAKKSVEDENLLTFFKKTENQQEEGSENEETCEKLKKKIIKRKFTFKEKKAKANLDSFLEDSD